MLLTVCMSKNVVYEYCKMASDIADKFLKNVSGKKLEESSTGEKRSYIRIKLMVTILS